MWPFNKKTPKPKTAESLMTKYPDLETGRSEPFVAYVERLEPKKIGNIPLAGKLRAMGFKDLYSIAELENLIQDTYGGGGYRCQLRNQADHHYLGMYSFGLSGSPMVDGKVVEEPEKKVKKKDAAEELREQLQVEKVSTELDEAKAERLKKQKKLGLVEDEEDPVYKEKVAELEKKLEEERRAKEDERRQRESQESQRRHEQMIAALNAKSNGGDNTMLEFLKMTKETSDRMFERMEARSLEAQKRSDELQQRMQEKADAHMKLLFDIMKESKNDQVTDAKAMQNLVLETWGAAQKTFTSIQRGEMIDGQPIEEEPTTLAGVVHKLGSKITDLVGLHMTGKQSGGKDEVEQQIRQVVSEQLQSFAKQLPAPTTEENPAGVPTTTTEEEPTPEGGQLRARDIRVKVDRIVRIAIKELSEGLKKQTWMDEAQRTLPAEVCNDLISDQDDLNAFVAKLRNYASPQAVAELINAFARYQTTLKRSEAAKAASPPAPPPAPPKARRERRPRRRHRHSATEEQKTEEKPEETTEDLTEATTEDQAEE